jgi:MurNAc alpha-1-phosphate uridylyltransferase
MTAILIFAAGKGTRMRHLTQERPKPLVRVAGRALIDHALALTDTTGVSQRVINLHYKAEMIRAHLKGQDITFSQEDDLLETGGGLRHARDLLATNPVLTMNADAVWAGPNPIAHLLAQWRDEMECLALLIPHAQAIGHQGQGDFDLDAQGRITRGAQAVYTGVQMIRTDTLPEQKAYSMNLAWDRIIAKGTMFGTVYTGKWCDVGQPQSIPLAEEMVKATHV